MSTHLYSVLAVKRHSSETLSEVEWRFSPKSCSFLGIVFWKLLSHLVLFHEYKPVLASSHSNGDIQTHLWFYRFCTWFYTKDIQSILTALISTESCDSSAYIALPNMGTAGQNKVWKYMMKHCTDKWKLEGWGILTRFNIQFAGKNKANFDLSFKYIMVLTF